MATTKAVIFLFCFFLLSIQFFASFQPGFADDTAIPFNHVDSKSLREYLVQTEGEQGWKRWEKRNSRRSMIGSTAPICTYNECRGCRYKCRAEQIPVDANDPINSAYHYRCVCHR